MILYYYEMLSVCWSLITKKTTVLIQLKFIINLADILMSDIGLLLFRFFYHFKMAAVCMTSLPRSLRSCISWIRYYGTQIIRVFWIVIRFYNYKIMFHFIYVARLGGWASNNKIPYSNYFIATFFSMQESVLYVVFTYCKWSLTH